MRERNWRIVWESAYKRKLGLVKGRSRSGEVGRGGTWPVRRGGRAVQEVAVTLVATSAPPFAMTSHGRRLRRQRRRRRAGDSRSGLRRRMLLADDRTGRARCQDSRGRGGRGEGSRCCHRPATATGESDISHRKYNFKRTMRLPSKVDQLEARTQNWHWVEGAVGLKLWNVLPQKWK